MAECPSSWTEQKEGCIFTHTVWKPVEYRRESRQLWAGSDCVFNLITERIESVVHKLDQGK